MTDLTTEQLQKLYNLKVTERRSYRSIGLELGISEDDCRRAFNDTDWTANGIGSKEVEDNNDKDKKSQYLKEVKSWNNKLETAAVRNELIVDLLEKSIEALPKIKKSTWQPSKKVKPDQSEDVGVILSDLHVGHCHTLEDTGGLTEYNYDIFLKRMENLKKALAGIIELHSTLYKLPVLRIFSLGDVVEGMNSVGAWSPLYINMPIVDQSLGGFNAIADFIQYFLGFFETIEFYGISGNHARSSETGTQKEHDNWDYVCYKFLEIMFKNNDRVKFHIPKAWWLLDNIRSHNFLMVHGHDLKGGASPITRLANFELKMASIIKKFPDYTLAGHFHNTAELGTNCGKVIINGSFVGGDVFSLKSVHAIAKPEQKVFGINDKHGITWMYDINLDSHRG
jgi:hypothetical protein